MKRYIALFLTVIILSLSVTNVFAAKKEWSLSPYTPGDVLCYLSSEQIVSLNSATVSDGVVQLDSNGKVTYEFFLPFDAERITLHIDRQEERKTRHMTVTMNSYVQNVNINGYYEVENFEINPVAYTGDMKLTLECDMPIKISSIRFEKQKVDSWVTQDFFLVDPDETRRGLEYSDYQEMVQTAVILNADSPVIKVNGANRYINYDNPKEVPYIENNIMYLPIHTFARAFGYYYEEDYTSGYAMLRSDSTEFVLSKGKMYQQINGGKYSEIANNIVLKNNTVYIPVRFYAQAAGKTVSYNGKYLIADYKERVQNICSAEFFPQVEAEFAQYMLDSNHGTTYYVAQTDNANDSNLGTADAPFATLKRAGEVAKAGDRVVIREGVYRETLKPENSGTAASPIIFEAAEGENVVISALEDLGKPAYKEEGLLVYDVGDWDLGKGRNQVFYKNEALVQARYPNTHTSPREYPHELNLSPYWPVQGNIQVNVSSDGTEAYATSETDLNQEPGYWTGAILIPMYYNGYSLCWFEIDSSENGRLDLGAHNPSNFFKSASFAEHTDWAYITCTKNAIDIPGEWHWEDGKMYMYAPEGETAETLKLEAKKRQVTVDLEDKKYIQIKNINTLGGGMKLIDSEMCIVNGGEHKYVSHFVYQYDTADVLDKKDGSLDTAQEDTPHVRGETGICLSGANNAVINSTIKYSSTSAITCMGRHNYIENNYVSETGFAGYYCCGIYLYTRTLDAFGKVNGGHTVIGNTIEKSGRSCVSIGNAAYPNAHDYGILQTVASEIAYNDLKDGMICSRDGGLLYAYSSIMGNDIIRTKIHHNLISDLWADRGERTATFMMVYWDNATQNTDNFNNICFWTYEKNDSTDKEYFKQPRKNANYIHASVTEWGNTSAGYQPNGKAGLTPSDYPLNKVFNSGSRLVNTYGKTYNPELEGYSSANAQRSAGTTMSDNAVRLNKEGEYVCFKNVEFGDEYNAFALLYRGSQYNTGDKIKVVVGDDINNSNYTSIALTPTAANTKYNMSQKIYIYGCEGTKNIYVQSVKYGSAEIAGIVLLKVDDSVIDSQIIGKTYANNYSEIINDPKKSIVSTTSGTQNVAEELAIGGAAGGSIIKYSDVVINRNVNNFALAAGSSGNYAGDTVEIRVGDLNSAPIATVVVPDNAWGVATAINGKLSEELKAGTYDIYLSFSDTTKTSNVWWFGFNVAEEEK